MRIISHQIESINKETKIIKEEANRNGGVDEDNNKIH